MVPEVLRLGQASFRKPPWNGNCVPTIVLSDLQGLLSELSPTICSRQKVSHQSMHRTVRFGAHEKYRKHTCEQGMRLVPPIWIGDVQAAHL